MKLEVRDILEDVAAAIVAAATVIVFTANHEHWNVWLVGDSRRWTAGALCILAVVMFALTARHIGVVLLGIVAVVATTFAVLAFWTASLTPLSLLAVTIVAALVFAVIHDIFEVERRHVLTH